MAAFWKRRQSSLVLVPLILLVGLAAVQLAGFVLDRVNESERSEWSTQERAADSLAENGRTAFHQKNYESAIAQLSLAIDGYRRVQDHAFEQLGYWSRRPLSARYPDDASEDLNRLHPKIVRELSYRARAYVELGRYAEALADLDDLVRHTGESDRRFLERRSQVYYRLGKVREGELDERLATALREKAKQEIPPSESLLPPTAKVP